MALVATGRCGDLARTAQYLLRHHGFAVAADGTVGNQTWPRLIVTVRAGDSGDAVRAVQRRLRSLPEISTLEVDGTVGPRTDAGVRAFQKALNDRNHVTTPVDGIVGPCHLARPGRQLRGPGRLR